MVYVLDPGTPSVRGFRLSETGLAPLIDADRQLSPENAEAASSSRGQFDDRHHQTRHDSIITSAIGCGGAARRDASGQPSMGPTPYGFAFTSGGTLVVTEAFQAGRATPPPPPMSSAVELIPGVGVGRRRAQRICWAVVTNNDRFAFTTNFADGAVSRYANGTDGVLTLEDATAGSTAVGRPGLRDEVLTPDGRFLYAIDADSGNIFGWGIRQDGALRRWILGWPPQDGRWARCSVTDDAHGNAVPRNVDNARELERRARRWGQNRKESSSSSPRGAPMDASRVGSVPRTIPVDGSTALARLPGRPRDGRPAPRSCS